MQSAVTFRRFCAFPQGVRSQICAKTPGIGEMSARAPLERRLLQNSRPAMSAPPVELPPSHTTSGHHDGLGRRTLHFDREDGTILERLHVRPELGAFEAALRERMERGAAFEDERFARVRAIERD